MAGRVIRIPREGAPPVSYERCIATVAGGGEELLRRELEALGATNLEPSPGAVAFRGSPGLLVRANRELRCASRVLVSLYRVPVGNDTDIYDRTREFPWESILPPDVTFAVTAGSTVPVMRDTRFLALRVKDAIVDRQRAHFSGRRSSVDRRDPGLRVVLHVEQRDGRGLAELSLDSSLRPLHERGYRTEAGDAPLRETLAASMLLAAGWHHHDRRPLIDPFCGSGTIAIEAALIRGGVAPGALGVRRYGYERWRWFEPPRVDASPAAMSREVSRLPPIVCADVDPQILATAQRNARRAGVEEMIEFVAVDVRDMASLLRNAGFEGGATLSGSGLIVTNPPYGERLSREGLTELYDDFGRLLKRDFSGWEAWILTEQQKDGPRLGLRAAEHISTYNGSISCRISRYRLHPPTSQ